VNKLPFHASSKKTAELDIYHPVESISQLQALRARTSPPPPTQKILNVPLIPGQKIRLDIQTRTGRRTPNPIWHYFVLLTRFCFCLSKFKKD
jgi:hypothetical protein